jgi:hypothetical protein
MIPRNEDEGRVEQRNSLRIKLFKESSRQGSEASQQSPPGARDEWDRRQSVRSRFASMRGPEQPARV